MSAQLLNPSEADTQRDDVLDIERSWHPRRVRAYAKAALVLMTGQNLEADNFGEWWGRNKNWRERLWFWEERLYRELMESQFQAGEYAEVMRTYRRCQHAISSAYGVALSPATRMSVACRISVPPAIAGPSTAAMSGLVRR